MAEKNQAKVINLGRLKKLLLGKLTFDGIKQLKKLTKAAFNGNAYEAAGALPGATKPTNALSY